MADQNLTLYVAVYDDASSADADYQALHAATDSGDLKVVGSIVLDRDAAGKVVVREHGAGFVPAGATLGGITGLVVGLFAPPLLLATAIGAAIGGGIGELVKRHEEGKVGVELEKVMPAGSSAIVAVVDDTYADRVDAALGKASNKISKAIDSGDVDKLKKAIEDSGESVGNALAS